MPASSWKAESLVFSDCMAGQVAEAGAVAMFSRQADEDVFGNLSLVTHGKEQVRALWDVSGSQQQPGLEQAEPQSRAAGMPCGISLSVSPSLPLHHCAFKYVKKYIF